MSIEEPSTLVLPQQLIQAREALRLSPSQVAQRLGVARGELEAWESGSSEPTVDDLWALAEFYQRDIDYFLSVHAAEPASSLNFRLTQRLTFDSLSLETRQTVARFEEICRYARELERILEAPAPEVLPYYSQEDGPELANAERARLDLKDRPIANIRDLVESLGVVVFHMAVPGSEFSGLSWHHPEHGPAILINSGDNPGRRAYTTAHEYCHLIRRDGDSVCDLDADESVERIANAFAAAFLMPEADVRDTFARRGLDESITRDELASLASRYHTSLEATGIRLEELGLIPHGKTRLLNPEAGPSKYFGRTRPAWRRRLGETYTARALDAYGSGRISVGKLARYLDIDIRKALDLVEPAAPGE